VKTRIHRDVATPRRPGRSIPAAMGTAGWAQAEADRARIRTVLRAPPNWRAQREADQVAEQVMRMPEPNAVQTPSPGPLIQTIVHGPVAKTRIGPVDDPLEREADQVADAVVSDRPLWPIGNATSARPQRKCAACVEEEETLQTKSTGSERPAEALASVHEVLRSPGQPLDDATRAYFEPRFGQDFSGVRVHTDAGAAQSTRDVNAHAYTVGHNIVFGAGRFETGTPEGRQLLAHELTHVVQQGGGGDALPGPAQERDAEATSRAVEAGDRPQVRAPSRVGLAAQAKPGGMVLEAGEPEDLRLGIKIVTVSEIEARVTRIVKRPGFGVSQGRADFNESPKKAKANLYQSHFRNDDERLSYALGVFEAFLGIEGKGVDPNELFWSLVNYEVAVQSQTADLVVHTPPSKAESQKLGELRQKRRAEIAKREAERARLEAERARLEAERAKRSPEDLSRYDCPDPKTSGPYTNQGIALPYDKLVPDPNPREGFDEAEVIKTFSDPRRLEQLYYDATTGTGKAAWLVCAFETTGAPDAGRSAAHDLQDILSLKGLDCIFLHTCSFNPRRIFSDSTASGQRMLRILGNAFADESRKLKLSNEIIGNTLNLVVGAKVASSMLAESKVATGTATARVPPTPPVPVAGKPVPVKPPPAPTPPKVEPPKVEPLKVEPPKTEPPKAELPKVQPPKAEPPKTERPKVEPPKTEPPKAEPPKAEPPKREKPAKPVKGEAKPVPDDPQRGVKAALERVKQKIATDQAELEALDNRHWKALRKLRTLEAEEQSTPKGDPRKAKVSEEREAAKKVVDDLEDARKGYYEQRIKDRASETKLQSALDAKTYERPKFRKGLREEVWQNALRDSKVKGKVFSPSDTEIKPGDPWVVGHKPKYEFWKHQRSAAERGISREQFIEEYNRDANHYRPETPEDSASHFYEDKTDAYLGP
jgi:hypothetical protein